MLTVVAVVLVWIALAVIVGLTTASLRRPSRTAGRRGRGGGEHLRLP
jgi:hypothetical protein